MFNMLFYLDFMLILVCFPLCLLCLFSVFCILLFCAACVANKDICSHFDPLKFYNPACVFVFTSCIFYDAKADSLIGYR